MSRTGERERDARRPARLRRLDRDRGRVGECGFTLFELLVVLAIVALVAGVAVYSLARGANRTALRSVALETVAIMREARASAITRRARTTVMIDVAHRVLASAGTVPRRLEIPPGIAVKVTAAAGQQRSGRVTGISFFPNGSSTGGALRYVRENKSVLVRVNWLTGRVSLEAG